MKIQVHLTIQSDAGQTAVAHEVARLERGPYGRTRWAYPWLKRARFWLGWSE